MSSSPTCLDTNSSQRTTCMLLLTWWSHAIASEGLTPPPAPRISPAFRDALSSEALPGVHLAVLQFLIGHLWHDHSVTDTPMKTLSSIHHSVFVFCCCFFKLCMFYIFLYFFSLWSRNRIYTEHVILKSSILYYLNASFIPSAYILSFPLANQLVEQLGDFCDVVLILCKYYYIRICTGQCAKFLQYRCGHELGVGSPWNWPITLHYST